MSFKVNTFFYVITIFSLFVFSNLSAKWEKNSKQIPEEKQTSFFSFYASTFPQEELGFLGFGLSFINKKSKTGFFAETYYDFNTLFNGAYTRDEEALGCEKKGERESLRGWSLGPLICLYEDLYISLGVSYFLQKKYIEYYDESETVTDDGIFYIEKKCQKLWGAESSLVYVSLPFFLKAGYHFNPNRFLVSFGFNF